MYTNITDYVGLRMAFVYRWYGILGTRLDPRVACMYRCHCGRLGPKGDLYTQVPLYGDGRLGLKGDLYTQVPLYDTCGPHCTDTDTDTMYTRTYKHIAHELTLTM